MITSKIWLSENSCCKRQLAEDKENEMGQRVYVLPVCEDREGEAL